MDGITPLDYSERQEVAGVRRPGQQGDRGESCKRKQSRTIRSLVMWSGGLDSTYALARLLRESDDDVYAHHIHLNALREDDGKSRSRRCEYEAQAVSRMLVPLKSHFGAFEYSESRADLTAFSSFARDTSTAMYFAAQLAMSRRFTPFDRIVFGVNDADVRCAHARRRAKPA